MATFVLDVSMSLDGFIAQPDDDPGRLHDWIFAGSPERGGDSPRESAEGVNREVMDEAWGSVAAVLMGRHIFDVGEEPWGEDPPFRVPVHVLTNRPRETLTKGATTFEFVTDGFDAAVERTRGAAGDGAVSVMGADVARQCLAAGVIDELYLHLVGILLGEGVSLFEGLNIGHIELERLHVIEAPDVTHLRYRVIR